MHNYVGPIFSHDFLFQINIYAGSTETETTNDLEQNMVSQNKLLFFFNKTLNK